MATNQAYPFVVVAKSHGAGKERPKSTFKEGFDISKHLRIVRQNGLAVAEFLGTGNFAKQFIERQRYEVDAGRDSEPILYDRIYDITVDPSLPRLIPINTLGTTGVVFERVNEGGEVKFATIGQGSKSVEIFHYATGLEYDEDLFIYNELFRLPTIERNFGIAFNALLNHIHFKPILDYSYGAANQTNGGSLTFTTAQTLPERYLRTFEAAITASTTDTANPRRGPYAILCSTSDVFTIERALQVVQQQGFSVQSSAIGRIQTVIAYDGWTGTRGKKSTTYPGVTAGKCYLIDLGNRTMDFQSWVKQPLRMQRGDGDLSRFIVEQVIWDTRFGVFADPVRAVEEITLPAAA
jgi:hypothetical protein